MSKEQDWSVPGMTAKERADQENRARQADPREEAQRDIEYDRHRDEIEYEKDGGR